MGFCQIQKLSSWEQMESNIIFFLKLFSAEIVNNSNESFFLIWYANFSKLVSHKVRWKYNGAYQMDSNIAKLNH